MRALLAILAVLVGLVAVIILIGAILPRDHVASRNVHLNQTPAAVWQAITNFPASPSWRSDLQSVKQLPDHDGHSVWLETLKDGTRLSLETTESLPPRKLVRRIMNTDLAFGGSWTIEVFPHAGGSSVKITEHGQVYNPAFRVLSRFVFGYTRTIDNYLKDLGRRFGEEVDPEG